MTIFDQKYYDDILRGFEVYKFGIDKAEAPVSGQDVVLSIDYFVQKEAEQTLQWAIDTFKTTGGMIVVARPNGQIIALAESPSFDPNNFSEVSDYQVFRTKFIQNYEPGSIMKALTYLSAVEKRVFNENQTYYDAGFIEINGWKISNFDKKGRGLITLGEAFEQSLNTGSVFIERLIGNIYFLNMLEKFKFDETPARNQMPADIRKMEELGRQNVLALFCESTNALKPGHSISEQQVGHILDEIIGTAKGRVIVASFSSQIGRVQQVIDAAAKHKRKVFVSGKSMRKFMDTDGNDQVDDVEKEDEK